MSNLTHCWFEGVNPWLGKYVLLKDLNQLLPTTNLQYLRLSDCIAFNDFENKTKDEIINWSIKQAYLAMGNLLTVCAVEKIDACPMEGFNP